MIAALTDKDADMTLIYGYNERRSRAAVYDSIAAWTPIDSLVGCIRATAKMKISKHDLVMCILATDIASQYYIAGADKYLGYYRFQMLMCFARTYDVRDPDDDVLIGVPAIRLNLLPERMSIVDHNRILHHTNTELLVANCPFVYLYNSNKRISMRFW